MRPAGRLRKVRRRARAVTVAGCALVAAGSLVACEPDGLASVASTTDRTATAEIERRDVEVRWLTCTADAPDDDATSGREAAAAVDCQGESADGKDITVTGHISRAVDGSCVRGDVRADVGDHQLFRVGGLGDCRSATPSPVDADGG